MLKAKIIIVILIISGSCIAQNENVVIVYSHNTNGILENCDCPERSYGALEKRAAIVDSIRNVEKNVLLLDSGDILDIQPSRLLHDHIVQAYKYINYDYWTPGDQDFIEGSDFFINLLEGMSASMVSSNILYKGELIGMPYSIEKVGKIRLGITGTINEELHKYLESPLNKDFVFENQYESLEPIVNELMGKTHYIILLSHSGIARDRIIANKYPAIDLIIGGHSQTILTQPEKVGSTWITQVGESGYRIGLFKIWFEDGMVQKIKNSVILLTRNMPDNPAVVKLIKNYHQLRLKDNDK
jgi:5'-nucleotidase